MALKTYTGVQVLQGYTGNLLTSMADIHDFYSHVAGEPVFTHQIPRIHDEVKAWLGTLFPELVEAGSDEMLKILSEAMRRQSTDAERRSAIVTWIIAAEKFCGLKDRYDVPQMGPEEHTSVHPLDEGSLKGRNVIAVGRIKSER